MSLKEYREKRNFQKTKEPEGKKKSGKKQIFVIQEHNASHLHYDFRLESKGVLKSWAIPKKPSLDPGVKRLAMETEDHPMEYADFEGTIPKGQYGAGTVKIWDKGEYENLSDDSMEKSHDKGHIKIELQGRKIKGSFALVKMKNRKNQWLFMKMKGKK